MSSESESDSEIENEDFNLDIQIQQSNINSIYDMYLKNDKKMNLKPEYQRDLCWSYIKMNCFIDSIMKNYIIPNYVIYKLTEKEKQEKKVSFECIDGQHRFQTIKLFIKGLPYPETINKSIYWKKDGFKVYYDKIPHFMMNSSQSKIRIMTSDEKEHFDEFMMVLQIINTKNKNGLDFKIKCEIFTRLQNGEKMSSYEKLKNFNNPIMNNIRDNQIIQKFKDKHFIQSLAFNSKMDENNFYIYFIIRLFLILDKETFTLINFLDLNIKKYLEARNGLGSPSVQINKDFDTLNKEILYIMNWIADCEKINNIIPELVYIYVCIYANYGIKKLIILIDILNDDKILLDKYNSISYYKETSTVISSDKMNSILKEIILLSN